MLFEGVLFLLLRGVSGGRDNLLSVVRGRGAIKVAASRCFRAGNHGKLGMSMPDCMLLESGSIGQDGSTILGFLDSFLLRSRVASKIVAATDGRISSNNRQLGMSMPDCMLLESGSIGQDGSTILGFLDSFLLRSRVASKIVAATDGRISSNNRQLRMEVVMGGLLQGIEVGQDGSLLLGIFDGELSRSRGAVVVAPGAGGRVGRDDGLLGVGISMRQLAERGSVGQDLRLLVGFISTETGRSRRTVVVAAVAVASGGFDGLLGVEEGIGHEAKALGIGEDLVHHLLCASEKDTAEKDDMNESIVLGETQLT